MPSVWRILLICELERIGTEVSACIKKQMSDEKNTYSAVSGSRQPHGKSGQRSYQFDAPNRLFVEGKELFSLKNYSGCIDKLEAYKQHSTDADLIQEADYMLVYSAYEQGRPNAVELLKDYLDVYPASRHADEVNFLIGSAHFGQGEYQKAIFGLTNRTLIC